MEAILDLLAIPLGFLMRLSYLILGNYGWAILLFTVLARVVLLPIAIWLHRYSIRLVKMTPALLEAKAAYFGDNDRIAEEQAKLYKEYKYNPLITLVPLAIQIIMLMGVIQVINHPMEYILKLDQGVIAAINELTISHLGLNPESSSVQLSAINLIQSGAIQDAFAGLTGDFSADVLAAALASIQDFSIRFFGVNIMLIPSMEGGLTVLAPVVAGFAAFCLCVVQNKANALQHEQGAVNRITTMLISVGLSAYLGYFVPMGVALYWVAGNFVAIVQQYFLNAIIPPKKHIDYEALEKSREKLSLLEGTKEKGKRDPEEVRREKEDYKRFFSVANKHIVFYSEKSGFYKYFKDVMEYILRRSNAVIHYVTSDPKDQIFELAKTQSRIKPYYIGDNKLITLMMKMDADIVVMTVPDLNKYHLKRSYVRKDIEYIYMFHYPLSTHMVLQTGALDHYDTIFCVGEFQFDEIRAAEKVYNLPEKKLIAAGYGQLEQLHASYQAMPKLERECPKILIAPSWQEDNILDSCIDQLLEQLLDKGYEVVVRPHPEYVKRYKARMDQIVERYRGREKSGLKFELDFTSNSSIFDSDILITDWSGTAYEFSLVTLKPAVFIDTKPKINNPEYTKLGIEPLEFALRSQVGIQVKPDALEGIDHQINDLLAHGKQYEQKILSIREKYIANFGLSGEIGGRYIISQLKERSAMKKNG